MLPLPCTAPAVSSAVPLSLFTDLSHLRLLSPSRSFISWYTPIVLGLALLVGVLKGFDQLLVVLVAGCPCALLGAAPFVQGATLTLLAGRHRLLVKHASALEAPAPPVGIVVVSQLAAAGPGCPS